MSLSFTPPIYRRVSSTPATITVPVGETWIVLHTIGLSGPAIPTWTITMNSVTYTFQRSWTSTWSVGDSFQSTWPYKLILQAGDSINVVTGNIEFMYWKLETDFGVDGTKTPLLRRGLYTVTTGSPLAQTIFTVPVGQTWICKYILSNFTATGAVSSGQLIIFVQSGGQTFWLSRITNITGAGSANGIIMPQTTIMRAGDQLQVYQNEVGNPYTTTINVLYWILEQDF